MSAFTVRIETENAAFAESERGLRREVSRILVELAQRVREDRHGASEGKVMDVNGNSVGRWAWEGD